MLFSCILDKPIHSIDPWTSCSDVKSKSIKLLGKVDCVTVSGDKHKPCVFPVLWKSEYCNECIEQRSTGKHWCATELKSTGAYSKFGHCGDSCPREGKEQLSISTLKLNT